MEPAWTCEDDEEALGVHTWLEREGIVAQLEDRPGAVAVVVDPAAAERAAALMGSELAEAAREIDLGERARLDRLHTRSLSLVVAAVLALLAALALI